ncbi:MAG: phosphate ABC transporter permease PstA [Candidatus Natronoplasma sp.]
MSLRKLLALWIFIVSVVVSIMGFHSLATRAEIGYWTMAGSLLLISGSCYASGIHYNLTNKTVKKLSLLLYASIILTIAALSFYIPDVLDLRPWEIYARIPDEFFFALIMLIVGVFTSYLSFRPYHNYSKEGAQSGAFYMLHITILLTLLPLIIIIFNIIFRGAGGITWEFLTEDIVSMGEQGGVYPAILGTLAMIAITAIIVLPLGVGTAIYLAEYARKGLAVRMIRTAVNILQGTPSIVHGLFGYAFFVLIIFDGQKCLLAGALTLAILTLPIVTRSAEEALNAVPGDLRDASLALGATKWQTIRKVVMPPSLPGILTGTVLGLGRAAGETAPIMFTAVYFSGAGTPHSLLRPIQALPYHLLSLYRLVGYRDVENQAWATALLLLIIVLGINISAIIIREKYRQRF